MGWRGIVTAALALGFGAAGAWGAGADTATMERGQYLVRAADCTACHTKKDGTPFAGGPPIATPFGTVYGTNITPDKEFGIGDYTADAFFHALTEGERPDGTQLYPAMPYTAYHTIPRQDADAMYAYLMSLKPVHQPVPKTDLRWPFSMRWTLNFWNILFANKTPANDPQKSPQWQRGRYLVDVLGHCGECHTPRNVLGAVDRDKHLQGAVIAGYLAPNLNPDALASRGWDPMSLKTYLRDGISAQGSMFGEMYAVFYYSTRYLSDDDLQAVSLYLMGESPPRPQLVKAYATDQDQAGRRQYLDVCAGCHGARGEGVPHVAVGMVGNTTLRQTDPRNLVKVIHDGIEAQRFGGFERMQAMPGFAGQLSDAEIADLVNYLRHSWGGLPTSINADGVKKLTGNDQ
jgi:mono/diheme cytochrome c family protein